MARKQRRANGKSGPTVRRSDRQKAGGRGDDECRRLAGAGAAIPASRPAGRGRGLLPAPARHRAGSRGRAAFARAGGAPVGASRRGRRTDRSGDPAQRDKTRSTFPIWASRSRTWAEAARRLPPIARAIRIKPDYADAFYNCGNLLKELKRPGEALASYDAALALRPDYAARPGKIAAWCWQELQRPNDVTGEPGKGAGAQTGLCRSLFQPGPGAAAIATVRRGAGKLRSRGGVQARLCRSLLRQGHRAATVRAPRGGAGEL